MQKRRTGGEKYAEKEDGWREICRKGGREERTMQKRRTRREKYAEKEDGRRELWRSVRYR